MEAPESDRVGPYLLLRCLGAGGTGVVYLGRDDTTGVHAAVKVLKPEYAADPELRERLRQQLATAYRIPRFCTAPILDADLDTDSPWVATEYIHAPALDAVLVQQGRLAAAEQATLAAGVAAALREAHHRGVSHGDLKPSDILLSPLGPRVTDLEIARVEGAGTYYPTPEQRHGAPPTPATDVFAWACVVAHAAGGAPPFGAAGEPNPDLRAVADPLRDLVTAALYQDPATRPSAAGLVHRLSQLTEPATSWVLAHATAPPGTQPAPPPAPPPDPPASPGAPPGFGPRRPRPALVAALAAALVMVLATATVVGWFALRDDPDQATAAPQLPAARGPSPTPSPTPPPADECLLGTWTLTSVDRDHVVDDVTVSTTSDGGSVTYYRPDGTFTAEVDQTEVGTAEGQAYEITINGTITGRYQTEGDQLVWSDTESDGELVVLIGGEEDRRVPVSAISEDGQYECDDDSMFVDYPNAGPHEYTRTSEDWDD